MKRWTFRIILCLILGATMTLCLPWGCGVTGATRDGDEPLELRSMPFAQAEDGFPKSYPDGLLFVPDAQHESFMVALWSKGDADAVLRSYRLSDGLATVVIHPDWVHMFGARDGEWICVRSRTGEHTFYLESATLEPTGVSLDLPPEYNNHIPRTWGDTVPLVADKSAHVQRPPHPDLIHVSLYVHDIGVGEPRMIVSADEGLTSISPELLERQIVLSAQKDGGLCTQIRRYGDGGIIKEWHWHDPEIPVLGLDPAGRDVPKRANGSFVFAKVDGSWHLIDAGSASLVRELAPPEIAANQSTLVSPLRDEGFGDELGRAYWLMFSDQGVQLQSCRFDDAAATASTHLPADFRSPAPGKVGDRWYLFGVCRLEGRRPTRLVAIAMDNPSEQTEFLLPDDRPYFVRAIAGPYLILDGRDLGVWIADLRRIALPVGDEPRD